MTPFQENIHRDYHKDIEQRQANINRPFNMHHLILNEQDFIERFTTAIIRYKNENSISPALNNLK
jgi:hypothetical protein